MSSRPPHSLILMPCQDMLLPMPVLGGEGSCPGGWADLSMEQRVQQGLGLGAALTLSTGSDRISPTRSSRESDPGMHLGIHLVPGSSVMSANPTVPLSGSYTRSPWGHGLPARVGLQCI